MKSVLSVIVVLALVLVASLAYVAIVSNDESNDLVETENTGNLLDRSGTQENSQFTAGLDKSKKSEGSSTSAALTNSEAESEDDSIVSDRSLVPSVSHAVETMQEMRVLSENGAPIAGAEIYLLPVIAENQEALIDSESFVDWAVSGSSTTSDENGQFDLVSLNRNVPNVLIIRKPGYAWHTEFVSASASGLNDSPRKLKRSVPFSGIVQNRSGERVMGARVVQRAWMPWGIFTQLDDAASLSHKLIEEEAISSDEGEFSFVEASDQFAEVTVEADGYAPAEFVQVSTKDRLICTLGPPCVVYGRVTDQDGFPVENAWIQSIANGSLPEAYSKREATDAFGNYRIADAPAGSISLVVWTDGRYPSDRVWATTSTRDETRVDFRVLPGSRISGVASDSAGKPVSNVALLLVSEKVGTQIMTVETDIEGRFLFEPIRSGETYVIRQLSTDRFSPRQIRDIPAGSEGVAFTLLGMAKLTVWLHFDGGPPPRVESHLLAQGNIDSSVDGMDEWVSYYYDSYPSGLHDLNEENAIHLNSWAGEFRLEIRAEGFASQSIPDLKLSPGEQDINVYLERGKSLYGTVVDSESGVPLESVPIQILDPYINGMGLATPGGQKTTTRIDGSFIFSRVPANSISLRATADGYAPQTVRGVSASFYEVEPLVIKLGRGGGVEGRVHTDYSNPSTTIQVSVRVVGDEDGQSQYVDQQGRFRFAHVPAGIVEVVLRDHYYEAGFPESKPSIRQVTVEPGETTTVEFDAATGVALEGRLENWSRPVMIEARLVGDAYEGIAGASMTDPKGHFHIPHLLPGTYRIGAATGEPGFSVSVFAEIEIGSTTPELLVLSVPGTNIKGEVQDLYGEPIVKALISIFDDRVDARPLALCLTDGLGSFEIGGLQVGVYDMFVTASGKADEVLSSISVPSRIPTLVLEAEAKLLVQVTDDSGASVSGSWVDLVDGRHSRLDQRGVTTTDGSVLFDGLASKTYMIQARKRGYVPTSPTEFAAITGQTTPARIVLVREGSLEVTVRSQERRPLRGVKVVLMDEEGILVHDEPLETSVKGMARFDHLSPGFYLVLVEDTEEEVEVLPGELARLEIETFRQE